MSAAEVCLPSITNAEESPQRPWLTVVMPVHQGERWIGKALQSLAEQGDLGIEVLVIDSSPDKATVEAARAFSDRFQMRVLSTPELKPWPIKTNLGVDLATADHVCILHQDDLWLPGRAAAARQWIASAPEAALHVSPTMIIDEGDKQLSLWKCPFGEEGEIDRQRFVERLLVQNFLAVPTIIFRKDAWAAAGGMDPSLWYTCDWDIWLKLAGEGAVVNHREATACFRIHSGSQTITGSRDLADFRAQMQTVLSRHVTSLPRRSASVERLGATSIAVNCALAAAAAGNYRPLGGAACRLFALGPIGLYRYFRDSRIVDRLLPRLRARMAGAF